jgi:hypothetical protein
MKWFVLAILVICVVGLTRFSDAAIIFVDDFENEAISSKNWTETTAGSKWALSTKFAYKGSKSLELSLTTTWGDYSHMLPKALDEAYVEVWFYDGGWDNKIQVDQAYLLIGSGPTEGQSDHWAQLGQTGNDAYDGFFAIFSNPPNEFKKTDAASKGARWVKMSFLLKDKKAQILVDDIVEREVEWNTVAMVGLGGVAKDPPNQRGGVNVSYWDNLVVADSPTDVAAAVRPAGKLTTAWGELKRGL